MTAWHRAFAEAVAARGEAFPAELAGRLDAVLEEARGAWPGISLAPDEFAAHLVANWPAGVELAGWLGRASLADLYLTCALALGRAEAIAAFDQRFMTSVPAHVRAVGLTPAQVDDLKQVLREKLFVRHAGRSSRFAEYSGRGSLVGWFRVLAVRAAIDLKRMRQDELLDSRDGERAASGDPTTQLIQARYRDAFNAALRGAVAALAPAERNLVRMHYLDGLTLEELAAFLGVHRATVVRRLHVARTAILDGAADQLRAQLQLERSEFESVVELLRSQLELSITSCLDDRAA